MEGCLAELDVSQEKLEAKMKAYPERLEANQEKLEASREKIEAGVEHYNRAQIVKATYVLTALQCWTSDVLR
jgi:lipid II:glycine glycyltransferase (peptidoglycan interpeptide bridge formation enzyme)